VSVIVYGDQDKPALLTYPDLALNRKCNLQWSQLLWPCSGHGVGVLGLGTRLKIVNLFF
jgi:hypothetical protein